MRDYVELPLQIGDTVKYDSRGTGTATTNGVVVERLAGDYVRVLWDDTAAPTDRSHSLRRAESSYRNSWH